MTAVINDVARERLCNGKKRGRLKLFPPTIQPPLRLRVSSPCFMESRLMDSNFDLIDSPGITELPVAGGES